MRFIHVYHFVSVRFIHTNLFLSMDLSLFILFHHHPLISMLLISVFPFISMLFLYSYPFIINSYPPGYLIRVPGWLVEPVLFVLCMHEYCRACVYMSLQKRWLYTIKLKAKIARMAKWYMTSHRHLQTGVSPGRSRVFC